MPRTRALALAVSSTALALVSSAVAQQTTGTIVGTVVEQDSGNRLAGVTVVLQGPQGQQAAVTTDDGSYEFTALPLGPYVVHFYYGDVALEQPRVTVSVDKTVRVNARMPAAAVQTVQVVQKAPVVDVGSSRVGVTFDKDLINNTPFTFNLGGMLEKAPGAFSDPTAFYNPPSAGLSFAGTTGAENAYVLDGVNMTSIGFGTLGFDIASPFIEEVEIVTGGYSAEYGRAMGGVVNVATKSGSNEWKGSAVSYVSPGFLEARPRHVYNWSTALTSVERRQYLFNLGAELGGPIVKDKLFLWAGYAPEFGRTRTIRFINRFVDANNDGQPDGANGIPVLEELGRANFYGPISSHQYAAKLSYRPAPEHTLSLGFYGINGTHEFMRTANADPRAAMSLDTTRRQDVSARWLSKFFDRRWQVEGNLGLHSEGNISDSPFDDMKALNNLTWYNAPSLAMFQPGLDCPGTATFESCPVQQYQSGGYGIAFDRQALRVAAQLKSSLLFRAAGWHQLKGGADYEVNQYDSTRYFSGPAGGRGQVLINDGFVPVLTFFRLQPGERLSRFQGDDMDPDPDRDGLKKSDLLAAPRYQDAIRARTKTFNTSAFLQDGWSPLSNLTFNLGLRWEAQQIQDYQGGTPMTIWDNFAPRLGVVYDPTSDGRAKVYGHFGKYYESIPMDLNDRAFGGEGVLASVYTDPSTCKAPFDKWTGDPATAWKGCNPPGAGSQFPQAGENLVVQKHIKGSSSSEVVIGAQYQVIQDLTVGVSYIKRWMGKIIEDASGVVANPGDIPRSVVDDYEAQAKAAEAVAAMPGATPAQQARAVEARFVADNIATAAGFPKPRRDYDALQLTATKRLTRNWMVQASYTYSRTRGNYPGLYAADKGQLDPNYTSLYDLPDLLMNRDGPLPNDRPHILRADGYYQQALGLHHALTVGLGAMARSGRPNNTLGFHPSYGQSETFILPRGSAGRTPTVTRFDLHLGYRHQLGNGSALDAFVDIFNLFNQRTALLQDQDYTLDPVEPIIGGDKRDLPHLKTVMGTPATKNPNYLAATAYQAPIAGRLGLRLSF
jgi:Carboxypeptidase regulatory-like domain/TonB dependent receptor-like, beta-barrel/TonB-dependent Receptor Plug Domain